MRILLNNNQKMVSLSHVSCLLLYSIPYHTIAYIFGALDPVFANDIAHNKTILMMVLTELNIIKNRLL